MEIDRERFLVLASAIAAATSCQPAATPTVDAPILPPVATSPDPSATPRVVGAPPPAPPPSASSAPLLAATDETPGSASCEKDNDVGVVDCSKLKGRRFGPSCEGMDGTCDLLAKSSSYRPRAAAAAAACLSRIPPGACDMRAKNRCYLEGVRATCPEARWASRCQEKLDMCRAAGIRAEYTKEECMKSMSAQQDQDREWAISQMGPSSEGKCRLMYTVY